MLVSFLLGDCLFFRTFSAVLSSLCFAPLMRAFRAYFVLLCIIERGGGGGLDSSLPPFLEFDGQLAVEALLCLPILCHDAGP